MPAHVNALHGEVRNEYRAWPFQLDCRRDIAAIELAGAVYRIRPLRWREKCNLARYVRVGEEFLQRHLIKVCLVNDGPLPEDPDDYEALWALTQWINAPGEEQPGLPLDATLLAGVSMSVAQQRGVRLSELAYEKAEFVERLWAGPGAPDGEPARPAAPLTPPPQRPAAVQRPAREGRQARSGPPLPPPGDMDRIRILPDPAAAALTPEFEPVATPAPEARVDFDTSDVQPPVADPACPESAGALPIRAAGTPLTSGALPASGSGLRPPASAISTGSPARSNARTLLAHPLARDARQTARFRVRLPGDQPTPVSRDAPQSLATPVPEWNSEEAAPRATAAPPRSATSLPLPPAPEWRSDAALPPAAAWLHETTPRVATSEAALVDPDELFEELADRLEQAAEQMGIDLYE